MLTIAGGIILALLILAMLPWLVTGAVGLLGIGIAAAIIIAIGYFMLNNFADVMVVLALLLAAGALMFLCSIYAQSRNLHMFGRKLLLLASPALSPKKQAEKEVALKRLAQDISSHCANQNQAIMNSAVDDLSRYTDKLWRRYREYGELAASPQGILVQFSATDVGYLLKVEISTDFPRSVRPTYRLQEQGENCSATAVGELKGGIKRIVKRKLLAHERTKQREKER
ncbi:MAG: hypothetical protein ACYDA8_02405 [Deferrisomatales bacterium]